MAKSIVILTAILMTIQSCGDSGVKRRVSPVLGVWEYMLADREGMAIITKNHFIHFLLPKQVTPLKTELSDSDKIQIFDRMGVVAGTLTITDSIVACDIVYSSNPKMIDTSFKYTFSVTNDIVSYKVFDDDGEVTETGKAKKIGELHTSGDEMSPIEGVWEYMMTNRKGMSIITEDHMLALLMPKQVTASDVDLVDSEKVDLYNRITAEACTSTIADSLVTCTFLYNKNRDRIGTSFRYTFSVDDSIVTYHVIDDQDNITGTGRAKRIGTVISSLHD